MKSSTLRLALTLNLGAALLASHAYASFGSLKIPGKDSGGSGGASPAISAGDFEKQLSETTLNVLNARIEFTRAQQKLAEALGLKTDSFEKAAEALSATSGASTEPGKTVDAVKNSSKTTAAARKELDEALAKSTELSAEGKVKFVEGTAKFAKGVAAEAAQIAAIKQLVDQGKSLATSASPMEKMKIAGIIKPASELAALVPGDVKEGITTFGQITKFATTQKLELPSEANAMNSIGNMP